MKWYQVAQESELNTPALLVYPDRVQDNIDRALEIVGTPERIRPHVKTHKMLEVGRMQVQSGIKQFKCATIAEAEMMAMAGAKDILIAYQLLGPRVTQLVRLKGAYPDCRFASLVDCDHGLGELSQHDHSFDIYIDVDVDHHRTGIPVGPKFDQLIDRISDLINISLIGFHAYDGHSRNPNLVERTKVCDEGIAPLLPYLDKYPELSIVTGGSPTFLVHAQHERRQCSPGTFVFWDHGYQSKFPEYRFNYAAVLATRIISKIDDDTFCFDLGHKHVASEGSPPQIIFFDTPLFEPVSHSEEHLVIQFKEKVPYQVGDVLYGVPRHICPTVALYPAAMVVNNHHITDHWQVIARNLELSPTP